MTKLSTGHWVRMDGCKKYMPPLFCGVGGESFQGIINKYHVILVKENIVELSHAGK